MRIVTYEDRPYDATGLKLLLSSLDRHAPGVPVDVLFPSPPDSLVRWTSALPHVTLHGGADLKRDGYNVKPSVLLQALDRGEEDVVWMDTDIIVSRDFRELFAGIPTESLVTTEEWFGAPYQGGTHRSRAWGFEVGRGLPATTNSCVVRVTPAHRELLLEWDRLLEDAEYVKAQKANWWERPIHLQGDQEVLAALLESKPFCDIPIHFLKRGRDVAHCFHHQGYIAHQMIYNVATRNRPYFVHGQGAKPWRQDNAFRYFLDVSAYTLEAGAYSDKLGEEVGWLEPRTRSGRVARRILGDNPWTAGLPLAVFEECKNQRVVKTFVKQMLKKA